MKRRTILALLGLWLWWGLGAVAQPVPSATETYYNFEDPVTVYRDSSAVLLLFNATSAGKNDSALFHTHPDLDKVTFSPGDTTYAYLSFNTTQRNISALLTFYGISPTTDLQGYSYGYEDSLGTTYVNPTNEVIFKYEPGYSVSDIQTILNNYNATHVETDSFNLVIYRVPYMPDVFPLSRDLMLSSYVTFAQPDFYTIGDVFNDPFYPDQFFLNNTGQNIDGVNGTADVDIDAPEAWTLSTGSSNIRVAVLDDGVEDHKDILHVEDGFSPSCWVNCKGKPKKSDKHGQACAGIIAATHNNNEGVKGVAPNIRIIPIRIFRLVTDDNGNDDAQFVKASKVAKAIGKAWKDFDADVMSISWGGLDLEPAIEDALNIARANGRNGKGTVVVAAAGNSGNNQNVAFPANMAGVIAVGAVDLNGNLTNYSQTGQGLSVVAPSSSGTNGNIRTTDREGTHGYNTSGSYTESFGGTSAACPQVAGIAALMLSVNSGLTEEEVKCRIEISATDIGPAGFDNDHGFGIANAYYAIALTNMEVENENISGVQKYAADNTIIAGPACEVTNTANVQLMAKNSIKLVPGFHANQGSQFHAFLSNTGPCGSGPFLVGNPDAPGHLEVGTSGQGQQPVSAHQQEEQKPGDPFKVQEQLKVYPNPNQGTFTLKIPLDLVESQAEVEVLDAYGRLIWKAPQTHYPYLNVDLTHQSKGLYLVKVHSGDETIVKKVIYK